MTHVKEEASKAGVKFRNLTHKRGYKGWVHLEGDTISGACRGYKEALKRIKEFSK